jgi:hypothetical protein
MTAIKPNTSFDLTNKFFARVIFDYKIVKKNFVRSHTASIRGLCG